jgi:PPIC-type PPIASE domain
MLRRIVKEPLLHFAVMAAMILAVYSLIENQETNAPDRITVTASRIEHLASVFAKTWQRPPNEKELKGLIDDYVKEEIYSREAVKMALDRDDTIIRRRLRQKMEFLNEVAADQLVPTDAELATYLSDHQKDFEIDPAVAFEQVFLNSQRHGDRIEQEAGSVLEVLMTTPEVDTSTLGDPTMLPPEVPLSSKTIIAQTFGAAFADAIIGQTPKQWAGPFKSEFGLHLVRVTEHKAGTVPELSEVRDVVQREWKNAKRRELEDARLKELLKFYDVTIETASQDGQP